MIDDSQSASSYLMIEHAPFPFLGTLRHVFRFAVEYAKLPIPEKLSKRTIHTRP